MDNAKVGPKKGDNTEACVTKVTAYLESLGIQFTQEFEFIFLI